MDALILSCATGGGHNSACVAVAQELSDRGHRVRTLDPYLLKSKRTADLIGGAYNNLVQKAPSAFGMIYRLGDAYRRLPVYSPVYHINRHMTALMEQYLRKRPCDMIVVTHLFPAEILANMKRQGIPLPPTCFIATDYTCIPFTEETACDYYVIPSEQLIGEYTARGIARDRLFPLGIPVRRKFRQDPDRSAARKRLGFDNEKKYILIAGGSIGAGQIKQIVPLLLRHFGDSARLIVICGNNRALYRSMKEAGDGQCTVLEYTSRMADYMKACDLFLSKPGGLSSTEAAAVGTPLIHLAPISGCEIKNMEFFRKNGMCISVSSSEKQLIAACEKLLRKDVREKMLQNQRRVISADSVSDICDLLENAKAPLKA